VGRPAPHLLEKIEGPSGPSLQNKGAVCASLEKKGGHPALFFSSLSSFLIENFFFNFFSIFFGH
jgi:hypothetical protein